MQFSSIHIRLINQLILTVSIIIVLVSAILKLDFLVGILIGCVVVILNFHWTIRFVSNLIIARKVQFMNLIFYISKFGISGAVLFLALEHFNIPPLALIIGLSNIVIAVMIFTIFASIKKSLN